MKRKKEKKKRKIKHIKECHKLSLRLICLPVSRKRRLSQKNFGKGSSESSDGWTTNSPCMAECFSATSCANWIITCSSFVPTASSSWRMQTRRKKLR